MWDKKIRDELLMKNSQDIGQIALCDKKYSSLINEATRNNLSSFDGHSSMANNSTKSFSGQFCDQPGRFYE